jgi:hypothetical protein
MAALDKFRIIAPEFKDRSSTDIEAALGIAECWLGESVWGSKYEVGLAYMAAHLLSMSDREGAGGPLTQESVGGVSASYGTTGPSDELLTDTAYGRLFVSLRQTLATGPLVAGGR